MTEYAQRYLPEMLLSSGPYGVLWWQWIALGVLILAAILFGRLLAALSVALLEPLARRTKTQWDDKMLAVAAGPATLLWAIFVFNATAPLTEVDGAATGTIRRIVGTLLFLCLFWATLRAIRVAQQLLLSSPRAQNDDHLRVFIPQMARIARGIAFAILVISIMAHLGYHVASLITGLGVGGIALALAARSTIENLFASFTLAADRPFELGDTVVIDGHLGTVEALGLRSTRLRTLDHSVITFPNAMLTDSKVESLAARERIYLNATIGVLYSTTAAQLRQVLDGCERVIRDHPKAWTERVVVRFMEFGDCSLNIEIMCWFDVVDQDEFRACRQDVLLGFMEVVEGAGTEFAFPTRTVHMVPTAAVG